ncbi:unnamed protein product [Cochlearia groenlandica]
MASSDDLEFSFDTNSLFFNSPETLSALTDCLENPPLLVSENGDNEDVGLAPTISVSNSTSDVYLSLPIENSHNYQDALTSFNQEIPTQNQSLDDHEVDYSQYFNSVENFPNMMTTGLQSLGLQYGHVNQSYQQPLVSQTIPSFSNDGTYISTMMRSNVQEVERNNGITNLNPIYDLQNQQFYPPPLFHQEEQYGHDSLFQQLKHIHENGQMQQPESSNMPMPTYMGDLSSNQHQIIPYALTPNTISNPHYLIPMISNSHIQQGSENYSPFANDLQNSSSSKTIRRPRERPRKYQIPAPLVPTTQTLLTTPRYCDALEKGKQHITSTPSPNPTNYNQYQNSYTNTMVQQSGVLRQRNCYDQFENECPSSKIRRIMPPFQEKSVADSSMDFYWQDENNLSNAANHHQERFSKNTIYDPQYAGAGLHIDPHLRLFKFL